MTGTGLPLEGEPLHGTLWRAGLPKTMKQEQPA